MPEPISFGFDEMVKAKAKADAEMMAEIERRVFEMRLGGEGKSEMPKNALTDTLHSEYVYDYNLVAELAALKRKRNFR